MTPRARCLVCDAIATRWCDAPVAFGIVGYNRVGKIADNRFSAVTGTDPKTKEPVMYTCDAPLCAAHATQVGHICGRGPGHKGCESIDHCPHHVEADRDGLGSMLVLDEEEAAQLRRVVYADLRRRRMAATQSEGC